MLVYKFSLLLKVLINFHHIFARCFVQLSFILCMAGNALSADSIYPLLEVKHIQLMSLGWLHCARLAPACAASRALQLLAHTRAFHSHRGKDVSYTALLS